MKKRRFRRDAPLLGMAGRLIGAGVAICLAVAVEQANAQGAPDLVVQGTAVSDRTLTPGQSFNFWAAVFNDDGDAVGGDAAATTLCYYRSDDNTLNPPVNPPSTPPEPLDGAPACPNPPMGTFDERVGTDAVRAINWSSAFNDEDLTSREDIQLTAPSTVGADYYYYACVAPVANEVNVDPMSNCSATTYQEAVRVLVGDEPDLVAEGPSVSDDILGPGQSFNLRVGVFNDGNGDSTATTLRYYQSANINLPRLSTGDVDEDHADVTVLGTDPVPALDAGGWPAPEPEIDTLESSRSRQVIELTTPTTTGFYYYFACVDILESERATTRADNNCTSIRIQVAGGPDLTVESPRASATDLLLGEAFTFSATVVNLGDAVAAATTLRYYRSTDATISTEDVQVGTDAVGQLARGDGVPGDPAAESPQNIVLNAPDSIGTYYYYACVDNVAMELVTGNNCTASIEVRVRGGPDLRVAPPSVSMNTLGPGQSFTFNATVINGGDVSSSATKLRYYRSADDVISNEDERVGEETDVAALAPLAESPQSITLNAPRNLDTYYYGACVVAVRTETVVGNNCSEAVRVEVVEQPADLVVQNIAVTDITLNTGRPFNLSAAVMNSGGDHAAATTLRYYRSADAIIDRAGIEAGGTDVEVGTDPVREIRYSVTFGPEDLTSREDIQLTAPRVEGIYHYYACVDTVPREANTENNCSGMVRVLVGDDPDLAAEGPSASANVVGPGQSFEFRVGVVNRGDGDSPATVLRHYRSTDRTISTADTPVGEDRRVEGLRASFPPSEWPDDVDAQSKVRLETELTAPTEEGTYYYGACVAAVPREADPSDDCSIGVRVEVDGAPDLDVAMVTVDKDELLLDQTFTLTATVVNYGLGGSVATTLRYYRSTDSTISAADDEVGTDPVGQLAPYSTPRRPASESRQDIELEAPTAPGTYYYGACVDAVPQETRPRNNCSRAVRVVVSAPPDLVVGRPVVADVTMNTGQSFNLSAAVSNNGRGNSEATTLRYYRSADAIIDRDADQEIGTDSVREILYSQAFTAEDKTSREDIQLAAPGVEGIYHYYACVDAVPGEADTDNNCSVVVRVLVGDDPNLAAEGPSASANVVGPGQSFEFRVGVVNRGDGDSPATVLRYYRSTDRTITTADTRVGTESDVPGLRASFPPSEWPDDVDEDSKVRIPPEGETPLTLTAPTEAGRYYYGACVAAVPREADPSDDCSVGVPVEVRGAPDLVVEAPSVDDDKLLRGGGFTLTATVANSGDGGSAATTLRCYRSEDAEISSTDMQVGTVNVKQLDPIHAASRNPSAQTTAECDLTAPNLLGTYYYGACVAPPPRESRTDNNCSQGVPVRVSAGPDLVVEDFRAEGVPASGKLFVGQSFRLTASVANEGDADFAETTLRFHRSTDAQATSDDVEVGAVNVTPTAASGLGISLAASPVGVQYYGACVAAVPNEIDVTNNCASASVRIRVVLGPDLVVEASRVDDDSLAPGQTFVFQTSVVNDGDSQSAQTTLRYYRSADDRISTRDTPIGTDGIPSLNVVGRGIPWSASRSRQGIQLKASSEGTYYYGACVDSGGYESNANNNCSEAVRVTVSRNNRAGDPDLAVDASVSANDVAPGDAFTLRAQVWNYGDEASETTRLRYYRSTDAVISGAGDDLVLGAAVVEGIPKSDGDEASQSLHSMQVAAPNAPGTYYYGACVDPVAGDPDAKNNCSKGLRVVVGDNPDGEEDIGEGADEAVQKTLGSWRGWRSVLLRPPPVGDGDAS